jgi:hypothetical protein
MNTSLKQAVRTLLVLTAVVVSTHSALARIGETRKEIDQRYGEGKRSDYQRLAGAETIKYHFNNFQVEVVFHDHKAIWEIFQRQDRLIEADAEQRRDQSEGILIWW